jgi:hypothetical protein
VCDCVNENDCGGGGCVCDCVNENDCGGGGCLELSI